LAYKDIPAMNHTYLAHLEATLAQIRADGFEKPERVIATPQRADIALSGGAHVLNFCANNYLGLADDARLIDAAKRGLDEYGYGCASVRFICGTQQVHKDLEQAISGFLGTDDTILYSSCFDANGGVFETLLGEEDAVISDELNHASIIDGVRLCKAKRFRYKNNDMADLEAQLIAAEAAGALQADRDRWRVLHGRHHCRPENPVRSGGPPRCHRDGGRLSRRRLHR
jgi:glycine C-acetyltransferase